ncbi:DUF6985 domain-containing protein [Variovorax sp. HJSM1_2]|uniref:DUF6985 domain-containing protein n=1 Tax=Variovorax sp. HJSM1_2 TaxID=3366263 RepID=UPI003BC8B1A9
MNTHAMYIRGLGELAKDAQRGEVVSAPIKLAVLNGAVRRLVLAGYQQDPAPETFHEAVKNFLGCGFDTLQSVSRYVFQQYRDYLDVDERDIHIASAQQVWQHIQFNNDPVVMRRPYGDRGVYISIACHCRWEPEHGLQLVMKNGERVTKVGPYDGHLTHSDAYHDDSLEDVIYR